MARALTFPTRSAAARVFPWRQWLLWLFAGGITLIILAPIIMVVLAGFDTAPPTQPVHLGFENWQQAWADPQVGRALLWTLKIVVTRGLLGFALALPLAWFIARTNVPGAQWLEFGFWISFFMPSLAFIEGWIFLLEGRTGLVNQWIQMLPFVKESPIEVYSFWGIIFVHLMSQNVSALFVLLVLGFRNMDPGLEESARTCGASRFGMLRQITLPLSRPLITTLVVLAIIRGMQSFEIERVLGLPAGIDVYATLVVKMLSSEPPRIPEGTAMSTFLLMCLMPLAVIQRLYVGRRHYTTVSSRMRSGLIDLGRRRRWFVFGGILTLLLMMTVVPLFSVLVGSLMKRWGYFSIQAPWTLEHWQSVLTDSTFISSLLNTLAVGILAGLCAATFTFLIAYVLIRTRFPGRAALDFTTWLPWAIPGVLLSLGLVTIVLGLPPFRPLYGTLLMLVLAIVLFGFPLGVQLMKSGLLQVSKELEEASIVCGAEWVGTQRRINVPILMPMLLAVGLITFVTAVNEVSAVVLLASTSTRTMSLLSLGFLTGNFPSKESAAVVTMIMITLCVGIALVSRMFGLRLGHASMQTAAADTSA
jgi:iron(III) transport system permease protein